MRNLCVFPGSFNPFTLGHRHLVEMALKVYDGVIVAIADQTYKAEMRSAQIRVNIAQKSLADLPDVVVEYFEGMLTDFLSQKNIFNVVRGVRNDADRLYEQELECIYKQMDSRVNFVIFNSSLSDISSEKVRLAVRRGDNLIGLIHPCAVEDVKLNY